MSHQRDLLNALAQLEAIEANKKEVVKAYNDDIKWLRKEVKRLRSELEAGRASPAEVAG